jgi:hypothetical protein
VPIPGPRRITSANDRRQRSRIRTFTATPVTCHRPPASYSSTSSPADCRSTRRRGDLAGPQDEALRGCEVVLAAANVVEDVDTGSLAACDTGSQAEHKH